MALSAGDVLGVWFAASNPVLKGAALVLADIVLFDLIRGKGFPVRLTPCLPGKQSPAASELMLLDTLQGSFFGWGEDVCYAVIAACLLTEGIKFAQGMQGGETGTGEHSN